MQTYYIHNGKDQLGPFTINELKSINITPETNIWFTGLPDWKKAIDIDELKPLFNLPPPFIGNKEEPPLFAAMAQQTQEQYYTVPQQPKRKTGMWVGIAITILLLVGVLAYNMVNTNNTANSNTANNNTTTEAPTHTEPPPRQKTPEELRQELLQKERNDYLHYLKLENATMEPHMVVTQTGSFWRREKQEQQGFVLRGSIRNNATMAKYKDAVITVTYQTETRTAIKSENFTIYQYFTNKFPTAFEQVVYPPAEMKFFNVDVSRAVAAN